MPSHPASIEGNNIGDAGAKALAEMLRKNTTLHTLLYVSLCCFASSHPSSLDNNSIGEVGAVAMAEALHTNTTLRTLGYDGTHRDISDCIERNRVGKYSFTLT